MDTFLNCHKCPPACAKKITVLVAFMVAKDLQPAAVIVEKGLSNFYPSLSLDMYVVPSSVHIMDVIGRKYTIAKKKLKRILAENSIKTKYSLTTDIWTSFANDAYISLTVHYIDDCWKMRSYTMATYLFPEQHTGKNIVEKF